MQKVFFFVFLTKNKQVVRQLPGFLRKAAVENGLGN